MKLAVLFIGIICKVIAVNAVGRFTPMSPCPDVFKYHQLNISDVWVALVSIQPPPIIAPIKLDVILYLKAMLPSKYVGILELNEPRKDVLARLAQFIWKPITYIIRFPLPNPLPTVKNISLNSKVICVGQPAYGPIITTISLQHTLFPRRLNNMIDLVNRNVTNVADTSNHLTEDWSSTPVSKTNYACGQQLLVNPLIAGGKPIHPGEWPWSVAIFISEALGLQFHCSATLISDRFSVTAGHCMDHEETGLLTADSVFLYFGKFSLKNWTEKFSVLRHALDVFIHPNYNRNNFSADLALIKFHPVRFTAYIKPICLWSGSSELEPFVGRMGTVVGWGRASGERGLRDEPHVVHLSIASQEQCLRSHADFLYLTSEKTLCAGNKNGTGPCNGDSGAGLVLLRETSKKWELRGIVSLSLLNATTRSCNLNEYVIFTDTAKFHDWLSAFVI